MNLDALHPPTPGPYPPSDGFVLALRAGRRRRLRTLGTGAACAAAAFVSLATLSAPGLGGTSSGLQPVGTPGGSRVPAPVPVTTPAPADPRPAESGGGRVVAPVTVPGGGAGSSPARHVASRTRRAVPATARPPAGPAEQAPIELSFHDQDATAGCGDPEGWCVRADVGPGGARGERTLVLDVCRSLAEPRGLLTFWTAHEADFTVLHEGRVMWRWSHGQPSEELVHEVPVDRWQCARWATRWPASDQLGRALPPGTYVLRAESTADALRDRAGEVAFGVG